MAVFEEEWYSPYQIEDVKELLNEVLSYPGDGSFIEIGCWEGRSTIPICNYIYPNYLLCVDTWGGNVAEGTDENPHGSVSIANSKDVKYNFIKNMQSDTKDNYIVYQEDQIVFLERFRLTGSKIKFIHIDSSHDYLSVFNLISKVIPLLDDKAIVCGDDFVNSHKGRDDLGGGVERAVEELLPGFGHKSNLWWWRKS